MFWLCFHRANQIAIVFYLVLSVSGLTHVSRSDAARGIGMYSMAMTMFLAIAILTVSHGF